MCSDLGEGSRCCAFYSATGFIFTVSFVKGGVISFNVGKLFRYPYLIVHVTVTGPESSLLHDGSWKRGLNLFSGCFIENKLEGWISYRIGSV
jgi:hypothetical protein